MNDLADLAELDRRLRRLEDERSILRVTAAYGVALDYGEVEAFAACFTGDGRLELTFPQSERIAVSASGHEELRAFARRHSSAPAQWHKHVVVGTTIDLDGDRAGAVSYYLLLQDYERAPAVRSFGRYVDRLSRDPDGGWRLEARRADVESALAGLPALLSP